MGKRILITGITGFIARNLADALLKKKFEVTAIVRPGTAVHRLARIKNLIRIVYLDLADIDSLKNFLNKEGFDFILHFGAIRGGRKFSRKKYYLVNVDATEQIVISALKKKSKLIFCSSVGVFGAIPKELPANNLTEKQNDNYYHYTKNVAEAIIQKYIMLGLSAVIIRPSITYGKGDFGFPYTLVKLVDKRLLFLPDKMTMIHLTSVDLLVEATIKIMDTDFKKSSTYIIADKNPVVFSQLVNHISIVLRKKDYPDSRTVFRHFFQKAEKIASFFKSEIWLSRIQLISKSWFYDVDDIYNDLYLKHYKTLSEFDTVIEWYKKNRKKKRSDGNTGN